MGITVTRNPLVGSPVAIHRGVSQPTPISQLVTSVRSTSGCIGLWDFEETSGTTAADSVGTNPGTYTGTAIGLGVPGYNSKGFVSMANDSYVSVPHNASLNTGDTFTLVALIRRNFIQSGAEQLFMLKDAAGIRFAWESNQVRLMTNFTVVAKTTPTFLDVHKEHLVVARKTAGTERSIWVDGVSQTLGTSANSTNANNTTALHLGGTAGSSMRGWMGMFAIFNVAVPDATIQAWGNQLFTKPSRKSQVFYGLHASLSEDGSSSSRAGRASQAADIGAQFARIKCDWRQIESGASKPGSPDWTRHDSAFQQAEAAGLKVYATFAQSPQWANGSASDAWVVPGTGGTATDPAADSTYMAWENAAMTILTAAINRYKPGGTAGTNVRLWECWNEPNFDLGWKQGTGNAPSARYYAHFWASFKAAVLAADPLATPICGALGGLSAVGAPSIGGITFLDQMVSTYGATFNDLSIHPYADTGAIPPDTSLAFTNSFGDAQYIRDYLWSKGMGSVKLHLTEFGFTLATYSQANQAAYETTSLQMIRDYWSDWVKTAFVFSDIDSGGTQHGIFADSAGTRRTAATSFETFRGA